MTPHLAEISSAAVPGAHAVLLLDQAGWQGSCDIVVPDNLTLLPVPPRSPELNALLSDVEGPVENVWRFVRDNWLSNRVFDSYADILDHCCHARNTLVDRPWRIMSFGLR